MAEESDETRSNWSLTKRERAKRAFEDHGLRDIPPGPGAQAAHVDQVYELMLEGHWLGAARKVYAEHYELNENTAKTYIRLASERLTPSREVLDEKRAAYTGALETIAKSTASRSPRSAIEALNAAAQLNGLTAKRTIENLTIDVNILTGSDGAPRPEVAELMRRIDLALRPHPEAAKAVADSLRAWRAELAAAKAPKLEGT